MKQISGQAPALLHNLYGMVGVMVEAAAAQDRPVLRMRPSDQQRFTAEEAALQVDLDALAA